MILVPFADPDAWELRAVLRNLDVQGLTYDAVDCSASPEDYPNAVRERWATGEDLIIVEHDILPWPGAIDEMIACPFRLCGFGYVEHNALATSLGCTKIAHEAMRLVELPDRSRTQGPPYERPVTYSTLDWDLYQTVESAGVRLDLHGPPVVHLHEGFAWDRSTSHWGPFYKPGGER